MSSFNKVLMLLIALCTILYGCGATVSTYQTLPINILVRDPNLLEPTILAIQAINESLHYISTTSDVDTPYADILVLSEDPSNSGMVVQCDESGKVLPEHQGYCEINDSNGTIRSSIVYIDCNESRYTNWTLSHLIAHEIFHCMGFYDHLDDPTCLNSDPIPIDDITIFDDDSIVSNISNLICDTMIQEFNYAYRKM